MTPFTQADHAFMQHALSLAEKGLFSTSPNPRVGCVIVNNGRIVGQGFHQQAGGPHAEIFALSEAGKHAADATVYLTLEPCCHHGRTPPCTDALIKAQVKEVIVACTDPNPLVAGKGLEKLQAAGIKTQHGLLEALAKELNIGFFKRMQQHTPWVRLKTAISLDGLIALPNGASQWITGPEARADGHNWRARSCAVLSGIGTIIADNPLLNVRHINTPRQPIRIVLDSQLKINPISQIVQSANTSAPVWIVHGVKNTISKTLLYKKTEQLQKSGIELLYCPAIENKIDLPGLMIELGRRSINELHIEAGATLNSALLHTNCVDELLIYQAPLILGQGKPFATLPESTHLGEISPWQCVDHQPLGEDWRLRLRKTVV